MQNLITDPLRFTGISSRSLDEAFHAAVGHLVAQEEDIFSWFEVSEVRVKVEAGIIQTWYVSLKKKGAYTLEEVVITTES